MKNKNCGDCKDSKQGKAYFDETTGLLCVEILEKYEKPKGKKTLVPFICTTCGTVNWKCIDPEEKNC